MTYEISADGSHVVSCDIPIKKGECIPQTLEENACLMYREKVEKVVEQKSPRYINHFIIACTLGLFGLAVHYSRKEE